MHQGSPWNHLEQPRIKFGEVDLPPPHSRSAPKRTRDASDPPPPQSPSLEFEGTMLHAVDLLERSSNPLLNTDLSNPPARNTDTFPFFPLGPEGGEAHYVRRRAAVVEGPSPDPPLALGLRAL